MEARTLIKALEENRYFSPEDVLKYLREYEKLEKIKRILIGVVSIETKSEYAILDILLDKELNLIVNLRNENSKRIYHSCLIDEHSVRRII